MAFRSKMLISTSIIAAALATTSFVESASAQAPTKSVVLNIASLGGQLDKVFKKAFAPFEQEKGITIRWNPSVSAENLAKVVATKANPEFDVALVENLSHSIGSARGLWATVDEKVVTNYADLYPQARPKNNDGVGIGFFLAGLFYRSDEFQKRGWAAPTSWEDLFRPEFCGLIGLQHPNVSYTIHTIIMLAGGDPNRAEKGIERLAKLKDCIPVLEPSAPKLEEKIQLGEYLVGIHGNIRTVYLIKQGAPVKFTYPKEGTVAAVTIAAPVKNAKNAALAQEFINWYIRPDVQKQIMEGLYYGPTNRKVEISAEMKSLGVPDSELMKKMITVDDSVIVDKRRDWVRQIERALAR